MSKEIQAAQIAAAASLTSALLQHVAPKWEEGRVTVEGLSSFAIDMYTDILEGIISQTEKAYEDQRK